MIIDGFLQGI